MTDPFQHALHSAATQSPVLAALAVFCANDLLFVLVALMVLLGLLNLRRLTWTLVARVAVSLAVAALLTLLLNRVVTDVRPFIAEHYLPLAHAANDNGFPSDHSLIAALLVFWSGWIDRRWLGVFVVGSLVFAAVGAVVAMAVPLPAAWNGRSIVPARRQGV